MEYVLDFPVTIKSLNDCITQIAGWIENGERRKYFICANPHSLEVAKKDPLFEQAIKKADLVVPDGIGIVFASKIKKGIIKERITGIDIFDGLNKYLNQCGKYSVFFLGSTEETLYKIIQKMGLDFPNIRIAGVYSPPFKQEYNAEDNRIIIELINKVKPDVLWVGMTAPKQEKWIYQNKNKLDVKFLGPIGAVFDFYTGKVKRSHPIFQKIGLEWLPRLLREPCRLWRRTFISHPLFLMRLLKDVIKQHGGC